MAQTVSSSCSSAADTSQPKDQPSIIVDTYPDEESIVHYEDEDSPDTDAPPSKRARVEEVPDEECEAGGFPKAPFRVYEYDQAVQKATKGKGETLFEAIRTELSNKGHRWGPFADEGEWEFAHWVMTEGLSHGTVDRYLKLGIVRNLR